MRTLNIKLFVILAGSLVLGGAGIFLVHYLQAGRIAAALLWQADHAAKDNDPVKAVKYLRRYLEFQPHDLDARAQLGCTLASEKLAVSDRARETALFALEPVIAREPERHDLRRLVARLALALTPPRLETAQEHVTALQQAFPDDGEVAYLQGQYYEAVKDDPRAKEKAAAAYRRAIQRDPSRLDGYVRLAALLRGPLNQKKQADQAMDDLVRANAQSTQAYLLRAKYRLRNNMPDEAAADVKRAAELAPDDMDVILTGVDVARARNRLAEARTYLRRGLEHHPHESRLYQSLAQVEVSDKRRPQAIACLQQGVRATTGQAQGDLLWHLANLLIDEDREDQTAQAEKVVAQLSQAPASPAVVPYLQGRILMRREDWAQAAALLERARQILEPSANTTRELLVQTDLHLGLCYEQLREPTRQLDAFRRVVSRDPHSEAGRLGMAAAQRSLGQLDAARRQFEELARQPHPSAGHLVELARLRLEQTVFNGGSDWNEIEGLIQRAEKAEKSEKDKVEVVMIRAQFLMAQNKNMEARVHLEKAHAALPRQVEFWSALAELDEREKQWEKAQALLDQVERDQGDSVALRLARARFWTNRAIPEARDAVAKLGAGREDFPAADQARLLQGLAEAFYRLGDLDRAETNWTTLAQLPGYQKDLRLRLLLFDLAMQQGQGDRIRAILREIASLEGPQGALSRYGEALRLIWLAKKDKQTDGLDEARALLDQVAAQRPTWPAVFLAKGEIDYLKGNLGQAIADYRQAIKLGETGPRAVRPLVQALYRCQRYEEANQEISRLQKQALTRDLQQISAAILIRQNPAQAAELAVKAVDKDSQNYQDFLWLGQILAASGRNPQEAEQHLRRALELGPDHAETWVALVKFLVNAHRKPDAEGILQLAAASGRLPKTQAALALAQCHELMDQLEPAEQYFQAALTANPGDAQTIRSVAGFFMRVGQLQRAEPLLRQLLDRKVKVTENDVNWARRGLAMVLVTSIRFDHFTQALDLVGLKLDAGGRVVETRPSPADEVVEEQRARARVLATRKVRALRGKAIALLEDLNRQRALSIDDQFLLVNLYEASQEWTKAEELLRPFLTLPGENPLYVVHYAQVLLHLNQSDKAEVHIRKLEAWETERKVERGTLGSADLRILALKLNGRHDQAIRELQQRVTRPGAKPEEVIPLLIYLGQQKRLNEALALCEERCWKTCPPELVGGASVAMLRGNRPTDAQCDKVEAWLKGALERQPQSIVLRLHLADLQDLRGRYQQAEELYNRVIQADKDNVVALNNRAWLLALKFDRAAEAKGLIDHAIKVMGPQPDLLDTRAVVLLALKQPQSAIADLEKAMTLDAPTGARHFHLARAHRMANHAEAAARQFREAKKRGLQRDHLHPVEALACGKDFDELERR